MMRKTIWQIFLLFSTMTLSGQSSPYLYWQQLTTSDQLRNSSNSFLLKDSKDFLWIGSSTGLQRFDGVQLKNYGTFPVDSIGMMGKNIQGQMIEDENQDLWITTYQAINHYEVETEKFAYYSIRDGSGNVVPGLHSCGKVENIIWLIHKDSLRQFDISAKKFTNATNISSDSIKYNFNRGMVRKYGHTTLVYVYRLNDYYLKVLEFSNNVLENIHSFSFENSKISSIHPISKDQLLIGGSDNLRKVRIRSDKKSKYLLWNGEPVESVVGISACQKNEVLLATKEDVFRYDSEQEKITEKLYLDELKKSNPDNQLLTLLVDDDQNIWLSSRNSGIYFTHPDKIKFTNLLADQMVTNLIQRENGEIWVFTNKKVIILNEEGEEIRDLTLGQLNCDNMMFYHVVKDQADRLWTNYYYLWEYVIEPDAYKFTSATRDLYMVDGLTLQDGRTIFSSIKGIHTYVQKNGVFTLTQIPDTDQMTGILFLYQNPAGEVISLMENTKLIFYDPLDFSVKTSVPYSGAIHDMFSSPNDSLLWIGGADGLVSYNYNTKDFIYHSKAGKLPNQVFGILPDEAGNLWLSSNSGIYCFNPVSKKLISYHVPDGIGSERFFRGARYKLRDGRLAFGGNSGLLMFDPKEIKSIIPLGVPQITDILIDGKKRIDLKCEKTGATNLEEIEKLRLAPADNKLEFRFVSKEYSNTKSNQIRYRLFPDETEWIISTNGGKCQYTNLEPGDYSFEIQASNSDGIWNTKTTDKIEITLLPPFRKTTLFRLIVLAIVSLLFFGIATFYQKQKQRKEQAQFDKNLALETQRLRIARDMHDDLGSRLSAISLKTAMLENKFEDPRWKIEMEKLTKDAQEISTTIRETIWAVDARNDTLGKLIQYLINYTDELFDNLQTDFIFEIAHNLPETQMVSGKIRRMVFLAYKEILNNIVKHARANRVLIEMKMEKSHFILVITDDGIGFDLAEKEKGRGNGLDNMRYRMNKIGGTCHFLEVSDGTSIKLNFKFVD